MWFQHNGAPAHFTHRVRDYLTQQFPWKWIGRDCPVLWPPRSPDLTLADFVWGQMRNLVYATPVKSDDLVARIFAAAGEVNDNPEVFYRVSNPCPADVTFVYRSMERNGIRIRWLESVQGVAADFAVQRNLHATHSNTGAQEAYLGYTDQGTWTLHERSEEKRTEAFEMWLWRRIESVKCRYRIRNETVLERVGEERMMLKLIRKRKRNWLGHSLRINCLLKDALEGMGEDKVFLKYSHILEGTGRHNDYLKQVFSDEANQQTQCSDLGIGKMKFCESRYEIGIRSDDLRGTNGAHIEALAYSSSMAEPCTFYPSGETLSNSHIPERRIGNGAHYRAHWTCTTAQPMGCFRTAPHWAPQCRTELASDVTLRHRTDRDGLLAERFCVVDLYQGIEPKSPDMNPADYWLWGYLKEKVFLSRPTTREELKQSISDVIENILRNVLSSAVYSIEELFLIEQHEDVQSVRSCPDDRIPFVGPRTVRHPVRYSELRLQQRQLMPLSLPQCLPGSDITKSSSVPTNENQEA
ncbi:hypothetical protein ANN_11192 [Periplaneta americana]|uniref:Transposable element Tc3 transposase n=1 Tax=Periplaneta americana TaxID=6978 RepID=A0ABQ8T609_PERAM|nr:hypothetical protein ANN_11192 [Periplaneta americana]